MRMATKPANADPIVVKKYANRRLYNTATSTYVTLEHLREMASKKEEFVVIDAKTGQDLTRPTLTQIIMEEESKGESLLPDTFLRNLIGFYSNNMKWAVPKYLESSMQSFADNQERLQEYFRSAMGSTIDNFNPFSNSFTEMGKQNMELWEQAFRMVSPFGSMGGNNSSASSSSSRGPSSARPSSSSPVDRTSSTIQEARETARAAIIEEQQEAIDSLQQKIDLLQREVSRLSSKKD